MPTHEQRGGNTRQWKEVMQKGFTFAAIAIAVSLLAGCGEDEFDGSYRLKFNDDSNVVLTVDGDSATVFMEIGNPPRIELVPPGFEVSVNDGKLILDDRGSDLRLVMVRNVDGQSLDCANCDEEPRFAALTHWRFDPNGPYDIDELLAEQERKNADVIALFETYEGARGYVVQNCMQYDLSAELCGCMPDELRRAGVSDADFMKFNSPAFQARDTADMQEQTKYKLAHFNALKACDQE
tara:strand:- start:1793 stop:2506 length:714 start_codon:yes stop_codon:yes gene_type:complete